MTTFKHLSRENPTLRPYVIDRLLRRGEVGSIVSATKARKSWLMEDLAIAITTGQPFLQKWEVTRGEVLLVDGELHPEVLASRIPKIAEQRQVPMATVDEKLYVECLRGKNMDLFKLEEFFARIPKGKFTLIIIDPLYRFWPQDYHFDENSNADVSRAFNVIDHYAEITGSAFIVSHHATKGGQANKSVTDIGAGAGSFQRAVDSHMVLRAHESDDAAVLGVKLRSFPPVEDTAYRWEGVVWNHAPDLDPKAIKDDSPFGRLKRYRTEYKRKTPKRSTQETIELVAGLLPENGDAVDYQDLCFLGKDQILSDRTIYRALRALEKQQRVVIRPGHGRTPTLIAKAP